MFRLISTFRPPNLLKLIMKKLLIFFLITVVCTCVYVTQAQQQSAKDSARILFQQLLDSSETYYTSGNYKKSIEVNVQIVDKAIELGDPALIHKGYRFLGYDYMALEDLDAAQENFVKSERYAIESKNDTAIAITYMDLANLYSFHEDGYEKAMKYHKLSVKRFEKIKDSVNLAKAHFNLAITAFAEEHYDKGLYSLLKADKLKGVLKSKSFNAGIENMFGSYYEQKKAWDKAEVSYKKAIVIGLENELSTELENSYHGYSNVLYAKEKYKEAIDIRYKYEEYAEVNNAIIKSAATGNASSKFQIAEYQKTAEAARQKNELQAELMATKSRTNTILWIISAVGLLLTVYLWYAYRRRKQLVNKLQIKNKEYLIAKEQSDKLARAKAKFFSTVSHELRTPLYGVIGLSTILLENKDLKKHEKDLTSLKFSADYLLALINDVLQMNKIDTKNFPDDAVAFNLRDLINTIVSSFEYMRLQHNNEIHVHIQEDIPSLLKGNSVRLSQILMNLIGNACKFTEKGRIDISAKRMNASDSNAMIQFVVKDTGMGIAKNKLNSIFNEFSQIEMANQNYQGTGLGLPIVKKLLQQANSEITVESEPGKGSTFSFTLLFDVLQHNNTELHVPLIDTSQLNAKRVLIVEDNRINQTVTKKILEKHGITCAIAENGDEAIAMVKDAEFHLILMDINMPVKNGIDATQEIRKFNTSVPIIALTAVEVEEIRFRIFDCGMNDIIVKPYDVTKFRQVIVKHLTSSTVPPRNTREAM